MVGALMDIGRGVSRWQTWWTMALQDIELRYRRSLFGPFWISASVVALILALAYVYSAVFKTEFREYVAFLGTGYLAWTLILVLVNEGSNAAVEHTSHMSNVPMPLTIAAGRVVSRNVIIFLHNAVAVLALLFLLGVQPTVVGFMAIVGAGLIAFVGYCAALALAPICTRFRDIKQVVESLMQVMFFLTPIFWMPEHAVGRPGIIDGNPFYHLIQLIRAPLLGDYPTELNWAFSITLAAALAVLAFISLAVTRKRIALWL